MAYYVRLRKRLEESYLWKIIWVVMILVGSCSCIFSHVLSFSNWSTVSSHHTLISVELKGDFSFAYNCVHVDGRPLSS